MDIDEAILHCEEVADRCMITDGNIKCENEHRQLAEWLKELKRLKTSADAVPVVRCKDCKYNRNPPSAGNALCDLFYGMTDQNGFCHFGERRTDGTAD